MELCCSLYAWSPANSAPPTARVPARGWAANSCIPKWLLLVGQDLLHPSLAPLLKIREFTCEDCNKLMEHVLPPYWQRHDTTANIFVAWNSGARVGAHIVVLQLQRRQGGH